MLLCQQLQAVFLQIPQSKLYKKADPLILRIDS